MRKRTEKRSLSSCLRIESLEDRAMLSSVPFSDSISISAPQPSNGYLGHEVADLNGDGMNDLVLPKIDANGQRNTAWRINNGDGTFGSEHEFVKPSFVAVDQLDIDGDGDLDLYGRENRNYVWYENTLDETGGFQETTNLISTDSISDSGDFNNDGLIDFIVSDTSSETVRQIVSDPNDPLNVTFLSTRTYTNKIILLRNTGSEFVTETIFEGESDENVQRTEVLDLDADGKLDVLLVSNNSSLLLRNSTDASEANRPVVTASFDEPELQDWQPGISPDSSLGISTNSWHSADVDEDGDIDFAYATFRNVLWARAIAPSGGD